MARHERPPHTTFMSEPAGIVVFMGRDHEHDTNQYRPGHIRAALAPERPLERPAAARCRRTAWPRAGRRRPGPRPRALRHADALPGPHAAAWPHQRILPRAVSHP